MPLVLSAVARLALPQMALRLVTVALVAVPPAPAAAQSPLSSPLSPPLAFAHDPRASAQLSIADGRLVVRFRAVRGAVTSATLIGPTESRPMQQQLVVDSEEVWRGTLPVSTTRYQIRVVTAAGVQRFGPFTAPARLFRAVPWVGQRVGYQIFPDRFQNGDVSNDSLTLRTDEQRFMPQWATPTLRPWTGAPVTEQLCCHEYFGGDLAGITQRLDSLAALGVSLLYLNPIFSSGSAHGYDSYDYLRVEPSIGDTRTLRTLLRAAKARGMRVLFDFVPNHVGLGFPRFQDAVARGLASPSWNWFTFSAPPGHIEIGNAAHYATFAGSAAMPKLNTTNPEVRRYLLRVAQHWIAFGFDGVRVDVPNELTNANDFARRLRVAVKQVRRDAYLVGEIWDRAPAWVQGDQFDALMNYAVGRDILVPFALGTLNATAATEQLARVFRDYPEASTAMAFNVIATHDTPRLLTMLGAGNISQPATSAQQARLKLASAMLFALPGTPVTFQGDECGFTGAANENRYPVQWPACQRAVRDHYQQLAQLKRRTPALRSAALRLAPANGTVMAWVRGDDATREVLALFNAGADATYVLPAGSWRDLVSNTSHTNRVDLPAGGWRYLQRAVPAR